MNKTQKATIAKQIAALHGAGVRSYDDGLFKTIVVTVDAGEVQKQRFYLHTDKGYLCRRSDKARTGDLIGPAESLFMFLKGMDEDTAHMYFDGLRDLTSEKREEAAEAPAFNDVMSKFEG